jgi:hypothetical protein
LKGTSRHTAPPTRLPNALSSRIRLNHDRAAIGAKCGSPLARLQLVPSASEYKTNAKGLHDLALKLADDAHERRIGAVSSAFYYNDEQQSAHVTRSLLEEGYNFSPVNTHWSYEDVGPYSLVPSVIVLGS